MKKISIIMVLISLFVFRKEILKKWYISELKDIYQISKTLERRVANDNPLDDPSPREWSEVKKWREEVVLKIRSLDK